MRFILAISFISFLYLNSLHAKTITVALAANVSYAVDDLKKAFNERYPDIDVHVILGSSGKLTAQLKNGAPYEVFMSANMTFPQALYDAKIATTKPVIYAQGTLAYLSSTPKDFTKGITLLIDASITKIALANPKTAPYGTAAFEALQNAKLYDRIKDKLVFAESISQAVVYATKATDIGFIAKSSLFAQPMRHYKKGIHWEAVDTALYTPIDQGIVLMKNASKESRLFYDFVLSKRAKEIFTAYGYNVL